MKNKIIKGTLQYFCRLFFIFLIINSIFYFGLEHRLNETNTPKIINDFNNMQRFSEEYEFDKGFISSTSKNLKKVITFDVYLVSYTVLKKSLLKKTLNIFLIFMTRISLVLFSLVTIYIFSIKNPIFPIAGKVSPFFEELSFSAKILDMFMHAFLPVLCLTLFFLSIFVIRLEKVKNLRDFSFRFLADLRFLIPAIISIQLLIENIFLWPGTGMLFYTSVKTQDMPVLYVFSVYIPFFVFTINQIINYLLRKYDYEV
jgi:ABC-type dipeptide/oligopeptide/nickel transport system permease component